MSPLVGQLLVAVDRSGLTMRVVCARAGVSDHYLTRLRYETAKTAVRLDHLERVAAVIGLSLTLVRSADAPTGISRRVIPKELLPAYRRLMRKGASPVDAAAALGLVWA